MKHIIAAGLTAVAQRTGAWAQSSVTLYGSLDAGVAYISNVGGHSKWIEEQGNMQPDRWGLKGRGRSGRRPEDGLPAGERLLYEHRQRSRKPGMLFESPGVRRPEFGQDRHADARPSDAVQLRRARVR